MNSATIFLLCACLLQVTFAQYMGSALSAVGFGNSGLGPYGAFGYGNRFGNYGYGLGGAYGTLGGIYGTGYAGGLGFGYGRGLYL